VDDAPSDSAKGGNLPADDRSMANFDRAAGISTLKIFSDQMNRSLGGPEVVKGMGEMLGGQLQAAAGISTLKIFSDQMNRSLGGPEVVKGMGEMLGGQLQAAAGISTLKAFSDQMNRSLGGPDVVKGMREMLVGRDILTSSAVLQNTGVASTGSGQWTALDLSGPISRQQAIKTIAFVLLSTLYTAIYLSPERAVLLRLLEFVGPFFIFKDVCECIGKVIPENDDRDESS
jgi:hypothetical protein